MTHLPAQRSTRLLLGAVVLTIAVSGLWSVLVRRADKPLPHPRVGIAPGELVGATVTLPLSAPSDVVRLRGKATPGTDRFEVERIEADIHPRLQALGEFLAAPSASALAEFAPGGFVWAPLVPGVASGGPLPVAAPPPSAAPGVETWTRTSGDELPPTVDAPAAGATTRELLRLIAPLRRLEVAQVKITAIESPVGNEIRTRVLFDLAGQHPEGPRHEWTGEALLDWDESGTRLRRWSTRRIRFVALSGLAFRDVSAAAFSASASYGPILTRGLDHFRDRIDAASGIEVYGHYGVAVGDADGDGLDDLYLPMMPGVPNVLLLGRSGGTFVDAPAGHGADLIDGTSQALFLDVDEDGDEDLVTILDGGPLLLEQIGGTRFRPVPEAFPPTEERRATPLTLCAADYDLDGHLDVFLGCYVFWRGAASEVGSRLPFPYHEAHNGAPNFLLRGRGDGTFADVSEDSGIASGGERFTFAASWGDYDDDGDADLYVANDFGSNHLWRNAGDGTFEDVAAQAGVTDAGPGMSVEWCDYDADGDLDLYVANMFSSAGQRVTGEPDYRQGDPALQRAYRRHARGNSLFRNRGDGTFADVSVQASAWFGRWAWASGFVDFNLDGAPDIVVQNGFVSNSRDHDL